MYSKIPAIDFMWTKTFVGRYGRGINLSIFPATLCRTVTLFGLQAGSECDFSLLLIALNHIIKDSPTFLAADWIDGKQFIRQAATDRLLGHRCERESSAIMTRLVAFVCLGGKLPCTVYLPMISI